MIYYFKYLLFLYCIWQAEFCGIQTSGQLVFTPWDISGILTGPSNYRMCVSYSTMKMKFPGQ